jgi:predicted transposase YdaD
MKKEDGIAMTEGVLPRISKDEIEWARLTSEYKYVVDTQSKVVQARREGRREGREEGRLEGRREGKEEGRLEEHMWPYQEKLEGARKLKQMGVPTDTIAMSLGLLPEEITKL